MQLADILKEKGYELPQAAAPAANYLPYQISGQQIFIAGQIPFINGEKMHIGRVGDTYSIDQGIEAARACALNLLAQANAAVAGDWSKIVRLVKLGAFVNCGSDFADHPKVVNGASDFMVEIMGNAGKHARFAVGASSLPFGVAVEIDAVFEMV